MSKITTRSVFYYGLRVTLLSNAIDFSEGGPEIQATLNVSDYSLSEYAAEVQRAMRAAGTQFYVVTVNRVTRELTISAPNPFTLLTNTGSRAVQSAYPTMGFSTASDTAALASHVSDFGLGQEYQTQFPVTNYIAFEDTLVKEDFTVNSTAEGVVQAISFGDTRRAEMNIRLITNKTGIQNKNFFDNVNGVAEAKSFVEYILTKAKVEFMPDVADRGTFHKCWLETTEDGSNGSRFVLKNMGTPDFYETGLLTFRKVN